MVNDDWNLAANRRLLPYITRNLKRYRPDCGKLGMRITHQLVEAKNLWAQDMRETADASGKVDTETQKAGWTYRMNQAEEVINQIYAEQTTAAA
jgi:hypothetical protein